MFQIQNLFSSDSASIAWDTGAIAPSFARAVLRANKGTSGPAKFWLCSFVLLLLREAARASSFARARSQGSSSVRARNHEILIFYVKL